MCRKQAKQGSKKAYTSPKGRRSRKGALQFKEDTSLAWGKGPSFRFHASLGGVNKCHSRNGHRRAGPLATSSPGACFKEADLASSEIHRAWWRPC